MPTRRYPRFSRRYPYPDTANVQKDSSFENIPKEPLPVSGIPMPNEFDNDDDLADVVHTVRKPSFLESLVQHIHTEELIIIGLIILLLSEGVADEFLIILLIYILLT